MKTLIFSMLLSFFTIGYTSTATMKCMCNIEDHSCVNDTECCDSNGEYVGPCASFY